MVAQTQTETKGYPWWLLLIEGVAAVIIGILLFTAPARTAIILVQFVGIYWLISGIFALISLFMDRTAWGWKLFMGILGILAGIFVLQNQLASPIIVGATLIIILGVQGILIGIVQLIRAFQGGGWGIGILGVLSIVFGIILLSNTLIATALLPWVLGGFAIAFGILAIIMAFRMR